MIDVFVVQETHSNELFEFSEDSQDDLETGDIHDGINGEELALAADVFQQKVIALMINELTQINELIMINELP